ncbi:MAG: hypothetical protein KBA46_05020 [Candidatus Omnitrophica bacterium]|nr:hypothetical protein [Candidatus Omnitrophota bacterium]
MKKVMFLVVSCLLLISLIGCEAFVRKFTRKSKQKDLEVEEMVLVPQEYQAPYKSADEQYQQYFVFWKSWHDELIQTLVPNASHKRQLGCIDQALKNFLNLTLLVKGEKKEQLESYREALGDLRERIARDVYGANVANHRQRAETIKRNILRDCSYSDVRSNLSS